MALRILTLVCYIVLMEVMRQNAGRFPQVRLLLFVLTLALVPGFAFQAMALAHLIGWRPMDHIFLNDFSTWARFVLLGTGLGINLYYRLRV